MTGPPPTPLPVAVGPTVDPRVGQEGYGLVANRGLRLLIDSPAGEASGLRAWFPPAAFPRTNDLAADPECWAVGGYVDLSTEQQGFAPSRLEGGL